MYAALPLQNSSRDSQKLCNHGTKNAATHRIGRVVKVLKRTNWYFSSYKGVKTTFGSISWDISCFWPIFRRYDNKSSICYHDRDCNRIFALCIQYSLLTKHLCSSTKAKTSNIAIYIKHLLIPNTISKSKLRNTILSLHMQFIYKIPQ